jgi:hypothetical protein
VPRAIPTIFITPAIFDDQRRRGVSAGTYVVTEGLFSLPWTSLGCFTREVYNGRKKSAFSREQVQDTCIKFFHRTTGDKLVSADKMLIHARGPVGHRKQQPHGIIPAGLHGVDTEATWSYRKSDGWV